MIQQKFENGYEIDLVKEYTKNFNEMIEKQSDNCLQEIILLIKDHSYSIQIQELFSSMENKFNLALLQWNNNNLDNQNIIEYKIYEFNYKVYFCKVI